MRVVKFLLGVLVLIAALIGMAFVTAPRDHWTMGADILAPVPGEDMDAWLSTRESLFDDITEGTEKRIVWAGEPGAQTPVALVYLHGYSATRQEIAPVPEGIAAALGANLFETRFAGHGRAGAAMGDATPLDWATDLAEAMAIGRRLGERVILMGTSTGGSIATLGALDPAYREDVAALVLVSPNFEIYDPQAWLLDLPYASSWIPGVVGETRSWEPQNDLQGQFWTTSYPTRAVFPMRTTQSAARDADHSAATVPLLVFYSELDTVVVPAETERVMADWGAPVEAIIVNDAGDDSNHVIAGDILSPARTTPMIEATVAWLGEQGIAAPE